MSQENVQIVQRALAAYMNDDEATLRALAAEDMVTSARPDQPDPRDHHGYEGFMRSTAEWLEAWDEHAFEATRIWSAANFVFVGTQESGRGRISGVPMEAQSTFVFTLSQRRIVRLQIFGSEDEALKAVGLAE
jgi:ketosteroid isomerase-like protein